MTNNTCTYRDVALMQRDLDKVANRDEWPAFIQRAVSFALEDHEGFYDTQCAKALADVVKPGVSDKRWEEVEADIHLSLLSLVHSRAPLPCIEDVINLWRRVRAGENVTDYEWWFAESIAHKEATDVLSNRSSGADASASYLLSLNSATMCAKYSARLNDSWPFRHDLRLVLKHALDSGFYHIEYKRSKKSSRSIFGSLFRKPQVPDENEIRRAALREIYDRLTTVVANA